MREAGIEATGSQPSRRILPGSPAGRLSGKDEAADHLGRFCGLVAEHAVPGIGEDLEARSWDRRGELPGIGQTGSALCPLLSGSAGPSPGEWQVAIGWRR